MENHEKRLTLVEGLLEKNKKHIEAFEKAITNIKELNADMEKLADYYGKEWIHDTAKETKKTMTSVAKTPFGIYWKNTKPCD